MREQSNSNGAVLTRASECETSDELSCVAPYTDIADPTLLNDRIGNGRPKGTRSKTDGGVQTLRRIEVHTVQRNHYGA